MSSIFLFDIASQRNNWLALRQETITTNIANGNTPGYAARDVQPFETVLQSSGLSMATSDPQHMLAANARLENSSEPDEDAWHTYDSGNSVSIEKELVKSGEVNSSFALTNGVIKSFHRMLLSSAKG